MSRMIGWIQLTTIVDGVLHGRINFCSGADPTEVVDRYVVGCYDLESARLYEIRLQTSPGMFGRLIDPYEEFPILYPTVLPHHIVTEDFVHKLFERCKRDEAQGYMPPVSIGHGEIG